MDILLCHFGTPRVKFMIPNVQTLLVLFALNFIDFPGMLLDFMMCILLLVLV